MKKNYKVRKITFTQNLAVHTCPSCHAEFVLLGVIPSADPLHKHVYFPIIDPEDHMVETDHFYCPFCGKQIPK